MTVSAHQVLRPRGPNIERLGSNRAKVVIEPLERGYGHTLGNALRRVLLSSIPGFAITEVEMDGVLHEYTTVEGLQEDVLEVLLNLKDVAIRMHTAEHTTLTLQTKGPGIVTAADIKTDHNVEILNPEHVICTLTKDTALNMRLKIERGFGYQPATARRRPDEETRTIGRLMLDALRARDLFLVAGCAATGALFLAAGTLLADLLLAYADPRVTSGERR